MDKKPDLEDKNILQQGHLDVGDGHQIYWVDWGNPNVEVPTFWLHGGPGSGFSENHMAHFDPKVHRVVFHDQRGAGRSLPYGCLKNNTSKDLVEDIEKLKNHLGVKKLKLCGNSWGSTLSLLYAVEYPQNVEKMLLSGVFKARKSDLDQLLDGKVAKLFYPELWEKYYKPVKEAGMEYAVDYYRSKIVDNENVNERRKHVALCGNLEGSMSTLDSPMLDSEYLDEDFETKMSLETHYTMNNCFVPENYILDNVDKMKHIPLLVLQGRYDMVCPPKNAYDLQQAYGENCRVRYVVGGHSLSETLKREVWAEMTYWLEDYK